MLKCRRVRGLLFWARQLSVCFVLNRIQSRVSLDQICCLRKFAPGGKVKDGEIDIRIQYDIAL